MAENLSTTQKRSTGRSKPPLYTSTRFIKELQGLFDEIPKISPATELLEALKNITLPPKWTINTTKAELTKSQVIRYIRTKPAGYILDTDRLSELIEMHQSVPSSLDREKEPIHQKKEPSTRSEPGPLNNPPRPNLTSSTPSRKTSDRPPAISSYLLNRMSSDAQKSMRLGILEMNALSASKLDKYIEHLSSGRIFYDGNYVKERILIDFIDDKIRYLLNLKEKLHEKEGEELIRKIFVDKLVKGKFDKIIDKWGSVYSVDEVAWQCVEKLGRKRKKIPLSDFALRQRISEILIEKYPSKQSRI